MMNADSVSSPESNNPSIDLVDCYSQVTFKTEEDKFWLILPKEAETEANFDWSILWQDLKYRLQITERSWTSDTEVHLLAENRLLDTRQLQIVAELLDEVELRLKWIHTSRRQTAVAAATVGYSVEQKAQTETLKSEKQTQHTVSPLYIQNTVRSGMEIKHPGSVIVLGDLNPGGTIISSSDIFIWGRLRGIAHAGAQGNRQCCIMALQMEPTQLRIAEAVARAPEKTMKNFVAEVAYITPEGGIRLTKAINFDKTHSFSSSLGGWIDVPDSSLLSN